MLVSESYCRIAIVLFIYVNYTNKICLYQYKLSPFFPFFYDSDVSLTSSYEDHISQLCRFTRICNDDSDLFFWPLYCLFFFTIRILSTSLWYLLLSSNSSQWRHYRYNRKPFITKGTALNELLHTFTQLVVCSSW